MLNQRRRHSRWRMFLILSVFLGLICNGELAPTSVSDSSSSSSSTSHAKRKSQDIGSLSDFTWQAWIVMDPQAAAQSGMDSATILRKITPKSVFIAPALTPCPEGYKTDSMNRCVKNAFNLDEDAHISFLLQRLNTMYANQDLIGNKGNEQKKSTGPLQLNIPFIPNPLAQTEHEEMASDLVAPPVRNQTQPEDEEKTKSHATVAYEVKNDTTLDEKETTIFLQNSSTPHIGKAEEKSDAVIVTTELVDQTNGTDFTETVSYKKPVEPLFDASSVERLDESDVAKDVIKNASTTDRAENSTKASTSVTPLFSPTKLPSVNDSPLTQNDSALLFTQTTKEIIIKVPDPTLSAKETTETPLIAEDERRDNETYVNSDATPTNWTLNESQEIFYEDVEYFSGSTNEPNEEKSLEVEDGEILKAGEAGMTIPTQNVERLHRDQQQQQNRTTEQKEMIDTRDQIVIRFNDSTPTNDKDEVGSNVSSEVSINGDLILETTLLDVSTERLQVTTKPAVVTQKIVKNDDGNSKESFDRNPGSSKPKVVFPQDSHSAMSTSLYKQGENVESERAEELQTAPSSPKSLVFDSPAADPITEVMKEETDSKDSVLRESPQNSESGIYPASFLKQLATNLRLAGNLVRFPNARQPAQQNGYVRFPSNEANSIHSPGHKQHYPADDHGAIYGGGSSTKSSVPVLQKPVYYLSAPPNWKPDRADRASATAGERQKQSPGLLGFWSNMPLIQDPAMYSFDQIADDDDDDDQSFFPASRGVSFHAKASTADDDKVYTQKQRRTAIVA